LVFVGVESVADTGVDVESSDFFLDFVFVSLVSFVSFVSVGVSFVFVSLVFVFEGEAGFGLLDLSFFFLASTFDASREVKRRMTIKKKRRREVNLRGLRRPREVIRE